jgi:hypothetical protein
MIACEHSHSFRRIDVTIFAENNILELRELLSELEEHARHEQKLLLIVQQPSLNLPVYCFSWLLRRFDDLVTAKETHDVTYGLQKVQINFFYKAFLGLD